VTARRRLSLLGRRTSRTRDGLDRGRRGVAAYWRAIADDIGAHWTGTVHGLWGCGPPELAGCRPRRSSAFLADLRSGGTPLACLRTPGRTTPATSCTGRSLLFPACYVIGELGLPSRTPYLPSVLDDLWIMPADAVFIDNRESNLPGRGRSASPGTWSGRGAAAVVLSHWGPRGARPPAPRRARARAERGACSRFSRSSRTISFSRPQHPLTIWANGLASARGLLADGRRAPRLTRGRGLAPRCRCQVLSGGGDGPVMEGAWPRVSV